MPRPDGAGIRLRLAAIDAATGNELVFIMALPDFERSGKLAHSCLDALHLCWDQVVG